MRLLNRGDQITRARLLAASQPHSGAWLDAIPIPSIGTYLDDETLRIGVAHRIGGSIREGRDGLV